MGNLVAVIRSTNCLEGVDSKIQLLSPICLLNVSAVLFCPLDLSGLNPGLKSNFQRAF